MHLTTEHREALKHVAEGNCWNARDIILSDLMQAGFVKREGSDRVLTRKGELEYKELSTTSG